MSNFKTFHSFKIIVNGLVLKIVKGCPKYDRVKDTDFGDISDLSPISVLFTHI